MQKVCPHGKKSGFAYKSKQTGHLKSIGIETFFFNFLECDPQLFKSGEAGPEELPVFGARLGRAADFEAALEEAELEPDEDGKREKTRVASS